MKNLFDQEQWQRRGENDARIATLAADLDTAEADIAALPQGTLGYAQVTGNQTGITESDLTGLSVAVTTLANRRIRITSEIGFDRTVADGLTRLRIQEGATVLQIRDGFVRAAVEGVMNMKAAVVLTPSAAIHTYKLVLQRVTGTGTTSLVAGATFPAFILVEDIGAA